QTQKQARLGCPGGTYEHRPMLQHWVPSRTGVSPEGTADLNAKCRMQNAKFQPSLRDLAYLAALPKVETLGYHRMSLLDRRHPLTASNPQSPCQPAPF